MKSLELFEIQIKEIMDCYIVRRGYFPNIIEESVNTKLEALQLAQAVLLQEVLNERRVLYNDMVDRDGVSFSIPNYSADTNPGGKD